MKKDEVKQLVIKHVHKMSGLEKIDINDSSKFQDDLGLDSIDSVDLIMKMEYDLEVEIPDEDIDNLLEWTIDQFVNYLTDKLKEDGKLA